MGDVLMDVLRGLRQLEVAVNAEELCEVLWLCQQGAGWGGLPATPTASTSAAYPARLTRPDAADRPRRRRRPSEPHQPTHGPVAARLYTREPPASAQGALMPYAKVRLPDAPALPQARELSRTLRPLRYDPRRMYPADGIDEEATALRIAQAGIRLPVGRTTRRRRLDADLVLDIGGSGPLWTRLAAELRTMLEIHGAFRSVRFWALDSDSADLVLLPGSGGPRAAAGSAGIPWDAVCKPPRKPLVFVLTDGTGRSWRTKDVYQPLREWAACGTVLVVQLLPEDMWNRTALRALPVAFHPANDGYHSGARVGVSDVELSIIGLDRDDLATATAIPVIGLDAAWVRAWLPLQRGPEAGVVPGYALLIPPQGREGEPAEDGAGHTAEAGQTEEAEDVVLAPEQRVQRFTLTASRDARKLARMLSVTTPTLPGMRRIRHELLPDSRPGILAEVMLGGLMQWTPSTPAATLSGAIAFDFHPGVQDLLRERPGGLAELAWDTALVSKALWSDPGSGPTYDGFAVPSGLVAAPGRAAAIGTALLPPYPVPELVAASGRVDPDTKYTTAALVTPDFPAEPLRIGIFGSTQSGRTTFLTVLGMFFTEWTDWRRGEQWRVRSVGEPTEAFISDCVTALSAEDLPSATIPQPSESEPLSFRLERRRRQKLAPLRWLRPERVAEITVTLQDRAGADFLLESRSPGAASYVTGADVLVYFFDPTYDDKLIPPKWSSVDFFTAVEAELSLAAAAGDRLHQASLAQHIAVCVPKLDHQRVFDAARRYGCVVTDPRTGLPWVPPQHAKRLFEAITYDQGSIQADYLRSRLSRSFDPKRMSFHALSSVGFWIPEGGELNLRDVCNVIEEPGPEPSDKPRKRLRGQIRPVHVLDPLISLVERATKPAGRD